MMLALPAPPALLALPWPPPDPLRHEGLVVAIARRYRGLGVPWLDLVQEGQCGLLAACRGYDRSRGVEFSTYATTAIRYAVVHAVNAQRRPIRIPRDLQAAIARGETPEQPGRLDPARAGCLGAALAVARSEFHAAEAAAWVASSEAAVGGAASPWDWLRELVGTLVGDLPPRWGQVIRLRYGLGDVPAHGLLEIGQALGVTKERARQLERAALDKLRKMLRAVIEREGETMGLTRKQCEALGLGRFFPSPKAASKRKQAAHVRGVMNRTENRYAAALEAQRLTGEIRAWAFEVDTLVLAPGMTLTPDFRVEPVDPAARLIYVDVKGRHVWEDATVKIKAAAVMYPQHRFQQARWDGWNWKLREFPSGVEAH